MFFHSDLDTVTYSAQDQRTEKHTHDKQSWIILSRFANLRSFYFILKKHPQITTSSFHIREWCFSASLWRPAQNGVRKLRTSVSLLTCSGSHQRAHAQRSCSIKHRRCAGLWRGTLGTQFNISRGKDAAHHFPSGKSLLCCYVPIN